MVSTPPPSGLCGWVDKGEEEFATYAPNDWDFVILLLLLLFIVYHSCAAAHISSDGLDSLEYIMHWMMYLVNH